VCGLDGGIQVHRGQGRVSEVLQQDARQETRAAHVDVGRCGGKHDLQTQGNDNSDDDESTCYHTLLIVIFPLRSVHFFASSRIVVVQEHRLFRKMPFRGRGSVQDVLEFWGCFLLRKTVMIFLSLAKALPWFVLTFV